MKDMAKLKMITLEEKIQKELERKLGINDSNVTEYVIHCCRQFEDEEEFFLNMNQKDESFTNELTSYIFFLTKSLFPSIEQFEKPQIYQKKDEEQKTEDIFDKSEKI